MDRYLVTGASGNLARYVIDELLRLGKEVVGIDLSTEAGPETVELRLIRADITDADALREIVAEFEPEVVIHMASLLSSTSEADPPRAWEVNASASVRLLEIARDAGCQRFFYPSTGASYGGALPDPLPEDFPQWPANIYGVTKVAVERAGTYFARRHGLDFRSLRLPMVISPLAPANAVSAYASHAFAAALAGESFVFPVGPSVGLSTIYVKDVASGIIALLDAERSKLTRTVYNVHSFSPSAADVARAISDRIPDFTCTFEPDPAVMSILDPLPFVHVDTSARADWGWDPVFGLEEVTDDMLSPE